DTLYAFFEILWARSKPISPVSGRNPDEEAVCALPDGTQELIALLVAGLNDKSIAREMDISARTLNRRITEAMKAFGARTRFQLGWFADQYFTRLDEKSPKDN